MNKDLWRQLGELCTNAIPAEYPVLLQNFPQSLLTAMRADDGSDSEGTVAEVELIADLSSVIDINREARACPVLDPQGREFVWPGQLLIIGESGSGDYFCLDTSGEYPGVVQYLHQAIDFEVVADTLDEYVDLLLDSFTNADGNDLCDDSEQGDSEDCDSEDSDF